LVREKQRFYAFGPFVVDTARHLIHRNGEPVSLTPKTYDTLLVLVENSGVLMSKDELMNRLWPDHAVEEANLTQQIFMIRKALSDGVGRDQYIVTVPGRGYRFAGEVRGWSDEPAPAAEVEPPRLRSPRWWKVALIASAAIAAAAVAAIFLRPAPAPRSLAVLPFQNLRQDQAIAFLGFSLADAIITKLDYVNSLTVRPSYAVAKFRTQPIDIAAAGRDLRVDALLTGSYIREGDDLRITAQLIEVKAQRILWRNVFDLKFDRLLTLHDDVVRQIIRGLSLSLTPNEGERLQPDKPVQPLAYEYYLRGVDLYSRGDFPVAIRMLEKSVEIDGSYPLTWAQLGRAYTADASFQLGGREQYEKAQKAYEKALALQPALLDARVYMANFFTDTGRVEQAVPLLRDALRTNPNHAEAHWELGYAYRFAGMLKESAAECERARQLDPTVKITTSAPNTYLYSGEYEKFLDHLPRDASSAFLTFYLGFADYYRNKKRDAADSFDRAYKIDPALLHAAVGKAIADGVRGERATGIELLRATEAKTEQRGVGDPEAIYKIAQAYVVLGEHASALRVLRRSIAGGFFCYPYLARDPLLDGVRADPEFARLLALARERHENFRRTLF
jgi:DNA-binding winged helix-turn-helix (wHTH) protein/TolB-like protein/Tfp pilus assembly protein PilF